MPRTLVVYDQLHQVTLPVYAHPAYITDHSPNNDNDGLYLLPNDLIGIDASKFPHLPRSQRTLSNGYVAEFSPIHLYRGLQTMPSFA
jgi:hypothetical protein